MSGPDPRWIYRQLVQTARSSKDVPVFLLIHSSWSTGAKYLPQDLHFNILKVRPQIVRVSPVVPISMWPVGHTKAQAPQPMQTLLSSLNGVPTTFSVPR